MADPRTALQPQPEPDESVAELLRSRALASSPRLLAGQAVAGAALNVAVLVWHPNRWGIAAAAMATIVLHALWSLAVRRTSDAVTPSSWSDEESSEASEQSTHSESPQTRARGWWRVRRAAAIAASASALLTLWFATLILLGRWIS